MKISTKDLSKLKKLAKSALNDLVGTGNIAKYTRDMETLRIYLEELEQKYNFDSKAFFIDKRSGSIISRKKEVTTQ